MIYVYVSVVCCVCFVSLYCGMSCYVFVCLLATFPSHWVHVKDSASNPSWTHRGQAKAQKHGKSTMPRATVQDGKVKKVNRSRKCVRVFVSVHLCSGVCVCPCVRCEFVVCRMEIVGMVSFVGMSRVARCPGVFSCVS